MLGRVMGKTFPPSASRFARRSPANERRESRAWPSVGEVYYPPGAIHAARRGLFLTGREENSFNAIQLRAQLLRRQLEAGENPDIEPFLNAISHSVSNGMRLMQDLLQYAKPAPPKREPFSLSAALQEGLSLARQSNVTLEWDIPDRLPPACGDSAQFGQVIVNLVLNALEAMPHGGNLTVTGRIVGDCLEVKVSDTGVGIPQDHLDRVFEPFFTTKRGRPVWA